MEDWPTIDKIAEKIDRKLHKINPHDFLSDLFECGAIAVSNRFDFSQAEEREERYMSIMKSHDKDTRVLMMDVFADIVFLLEHQINSYVGFDDYLGKLYMKSGTSNNRAGQFFTPYHVSKLVAAAGIDEDRIQKHKQDDDVMVMMEPSCGSGGLVLATADVLYNKYDFNFSWNMFVKCSDLDKRCVHMSYLQLGLAGIPAEIEWADSMTGQVMEKWRTPTMMMFWERFERYSR